MKNLFLVALLFSASCLYSQEKKFEIIVGSSVSEFYPRFSVKFFLYAPDGEIIFESGLFEQKNYSEFSPSNWEKGTGDYKLVVSVFNNYNMNLCDIYNFKFALTGNERNVLADIYFSDNDGKDPKHLSRFTVNRYYASTDSVVLTEDSPPKSGQDLKYSITNHTTRTLYCFCFYFCVVGELKKWGEGKWNELNRGGRACGMFRLDAPLEPGKTICACENGFIDYGRDLSAGTYKYSTKYTYKKTFGAISDPDEKGVSKNVIDYYILEKEFEIKDE